MKIKLAYIFTFAIFLIANSQDSAERLLYVVDSIPIIDEPEEGFNILTQNQINNVVTAKDKEIIAKYGLKDIEGVVYVFTKSYVNRPDSLKRIPTTKKMKRRNGFWFLENESTPYTGRFIDYYINGKKQGEGFLQNGRLEGNRKMYYLNGKTSDEIEYKKGVSSGIEKRFYENGKLKQIGEIENGKEVGVWEKYHRNGQLKQKTTFNNDGKMEGKSIIYYSTGKIKLTYEYKNGVYIKNKRFDKLYKYYQEAQDLYKVGNFKGAIKKYSNCLEQDSTFVDAYFARGTAKLNMFQFDEARQDFNKSIAIEPLYMEAYANRAFALIRKYEYKNNRVLSKTREVTIMAEKDIKMPGTDLVKICRDLSYSTSLGNKNKQVLEAKSKFCSQ